MAFRTFCRLISIWESKQANLDKLLFIANRYRQFTKGFLSRPLNRDPIPMAMFFLYMDVGWILNTRGAVCYGSIAVQCVRSEVLQGVFVFCGGLSCTTIKVSVV